MLELYTHHGRTTPDESLNDWGPNGPRLRGVAGFHETYRTTTVVYFESAEACEAARLATGWQEWDENALEMQFADDLLFVPAIPEGEARYFGDWGLMLRREPK